MNQRLCFSLCLVVFLAGGVILAIGGGESGTGVGTTVALAGLVVIGWTLLAAPKGAGD